MQDKGGRDQYVHGDYNVACSMCGRKRKASEVVKNWQGMWRCPEHNEERQPQDFVRAVPDIQTPPFTQPPSDVFVQLCYPNSTTAIAEFAVAYCAIAGYINPMFNPDVNEY